MRRVKVGLVADSDPAARRALVDALALTGLATVECSDGRRLWPLLADNRALHVVFADACLDGLDGAELARRMAANRELRRIPVVVTSTKTDPATVGRLLAVGVTAVIDKRAAADEVQRALAAVDRAAERQSLSSTSSLAARQAHGPRAVAASTPTPPEVSP